MADIHIWAPDLFSITGGIQTFSQRLIEAVTLGEIADDVRILVKNDLPADIPSNDSYRNVDVFGHWGASMRTPAFGWGCFRRAFQDRPRVIVSTHLNFGPLAWGIQRALGTPYVLVAHGIDAWRIDSDVRLRALREANRVLAVSRYTRDWLIEEGGLDGERVEILPNTFTPERYAIRPKSPRLLEKYGLLPETPVILTVCRLAQAERYKGYDQIIKAMPRILRHVPDARYLIVGKGPDKPRIERLIAEAGVRDAVILAGFIPDEELVDHYNLCDLFSMPSKAEGFGIVYLEALACGKPVLAGNKDGSRDAIADGELGILLDPDDVDAIAEESIKVLLRRHEHPNLFRREYLRERVIALFGFEAFTRILAERLSPFLANGHRG